MALLDVTNEEEVKKYDEFVRNSPYRSMMQDRAWAEVKDDWGNEHVYLEKDGEIIAAMSILIKRLPLGYSMLYATRGPVCDITDIDLVQELLKEVDVVAKKHKAIMLKFDPEVPYSDELYQLYSNAGFQLVSKDDDQEKLIQPRKNMVLDLKDYDEESIMMRFSKRGRSSIRGGIRRGVEVRYSRSDEDINLLHETYRTMAERNKITIRSKEYFKQIRDSYEDARVYIATHEDDLLAAALTINYNGKMYYLYAGSTNIKRNLNPNHVINYEMIKWGLEEGAEQYDFGGFFEIGDGLYNFKKSFCDKDGPVEYIGEIDKVYKPFMYNLLERVIPMVKRLRKRSNEN
ncbi:lipid II:glycine glycyltransferase FemX [Sporosarcina ureilytica]|uniref:Lipid II:glycine glycyltransferase n=1 Tax=Sporosarcina ureilytica TaxID=298596 RepID=A0A1D8JDM2_9BACL|nr:peptidoglycan bridge formation glycyltransferase FemA/FemB family protein [Sporosarcina ureilytica]AOV06817.1 aminoacyltransferase [Sporosarcina ureilytica]